MGKGMEEVKAADIQVVPEEFLEKAKNGGTAMELIKSLNLASWGSDVSCPSLCLLVHRRKVLNVSEREKERGR